MFNFTSVTLCLVLFPWTAEDVDIYRCMSFFV